jgi:hypothetical protein
MADERDKKLLLEFMLTLGLGVRHEYAEKRVDAFLADFNARQSQASIPANCAKCDKPWSGVYQRDADTLVCLCSRCGHVHFSPIAALRSPGEPDPTKCTRCSAVIGPLARKAMWFEARQAHEWLCLECARRETSHG